MPFKKDELRLYKASITWRDHENLSTNWRGETMETTIIKAQDKLLSKAIEEAGDDLQDIVYCEVQLAVW